jgi:spoIIIJ-associated protein
MEWVETTGRSIDEAKDAALDQLGVDEQDAEFEVIEDAKLGLFGRIRSEARVRARVRPTRPRAKDEGRDKRRRSGGQGRGAGVGASAGSEGGGGRGSRSESGAATGGGRAAAVDDAVGASTAVGASQDDELSSGPSTSNGGGNGGGRNSSRSGRERSNGGRGRRPAGRGDEGSAAPRVADDGGAEMDVPLAEQAEEARTFLQGLVERFGARGDVEIAEIDEDTVELRVTGEDLGLLIGPKGQTLAAIQELTRSAVQRRPGGGRLLVDVSGYRQKRRVALEAFTRQQVERVLESGNRLVLEPMAPADRKVVHDTVNTIDGVITTSQGEEPNRRVVIMPEQG